MINIKTCRRIKRYLEKMGLKLAWQCGWGNWQSEIVSTDKQVSDFYKHWNFVLFVHS